MRLGVNLLRPVSLSLIALPPDPLARSRKCFREVIAPNQTNSESPRSGSSGYTVWIIRKHVGVVNAL
jgi:hypothetical protein